MGSLVYFSSVSDTTHRFVQRLGLEDRGQSVHRIPLRPKDEFLRVDEPYVLMIPTYGGGNEAGQCPARSSSS